MTVDAIFERLNGEWPVISEAWPATVILSVVVGSVVWAVVYFLSRRQLANLKKCLELRDDQLADAKAQIKKLARDLELLVGERQARQDAVLVSLREQLASANGS